MDVQFTTCIQVGVADWKSAVSDEDSLARHRKQNPKLHDKLGRIEVMLEREMSAPQFDRQSVKSEILAISAPHRFEILQAQTETEQNRKLEEELVRQEQERLIKAGIEAEKARIWNFLDRFCREIQTGERLNGNIPYARGTVKSWGSFRRLYGLFDRAHRFTWDQVDRAFVTKFVTFMEKKGYMVSAQNKYLVEMRALISYAYADGLHHNERSLLYFSKKKVEERDKAAEIYLTEGELQALYEMPLTGLRDQVRDVFLAGCYTCQRVSDYNRISKASFTTTAKGTPVIKLVQKKTRNEVKIPIMNPNLRAICEKYGCDLPPVDDVILNRNIKDILRELAEIVPSLADAVPTRLTMKQRKLAEEGKLTVMHNDEGEIVMPRYNCVTSHTARRSGITNMYLTHKYNILQMMHVSGHKTQKTFMDYIKLSSDEIADETDAIANGRRNEMF